MSRILEADAPGSLSLGFNNGGTTRAYLRLVCRLVELFGLDLRARCLSLGCCCANSLHVRFVSPGFRAKTMAGVCCLPYLHLAFLLSRHVREQDTSSD